MEPTPYCVCLCASAMRALLPVTALVLSALLTATASPGTAPQSLSDSNVGMDLPSERLSDSNVGMDLPSERLSATSVRMSGRALLSTPSPAPTSQPSQLPTVPSKINSEWSWGDVRICVCCAIYSSNPVPRLLRLSITCETLQLTSSSASPSPPHSYTHRCYGLCVLSHLAFSFGSDG